MSYLKPGTRCVIIAGCPENIGMVVEVIERLGEVRHRPDAYSIRTLSGRKFNQCWHDNGLLRGTSDTAITDRHKLRPLLDIKGDVDEASMQSAVDLNQKTIEPAQVADFILESP